MCPALPLHYTSHCQPSFSTVRPIYFRVSSKMHLQLNSVKFVTSHLSTLISYIYLWKDVSSSTSSLHQAREGGGTPPVTRQTKLRFLFSPTTSSTPGRTTAWLLSDSIRGLSGGSAITIIFLYYCTPRSIQRHQEPFKSCLHRKRYF